MRAGPGNTETPNSHYPSWGSGTACQWNIQRARSDISLPLMGIGNLLADVRARLAALNSLPLMGIGNFANGADTEVTLHYLITPHGDRERARKS